MIDHTGVIVSDFTKSKAFYSAALGAIGIAVVKEFSASVTGNTDVAGYGAQEASAQGLSPEFWLARGEPGSIPVHIAFRVSSRDNGAPGLRPQYHPNYYGAFVLDPDGHNIETVCRESA